MEQRGLIAMILGIVGLSMSCAGAGFFPILLLGIVLTGAAVILGWQEHQAIQRGEAPQDGSTFALVGMITGGIGCFLQTVVGMLIAAVVAFYLLMLVINIFIFVIAIIGSAR